MIFSPCKWVLMLVNRPVLARKSVSLRWTLGPFMGWGLIENLPWVQGMARTMSHPPRRTNAFSAQRFADKTQANIFSRCIFPSLGFILFFRQRGKNEAEARKSTKLMRNGGRVFKGVFGELGGAGARQYGAKDIGQNALQKKLHIICRQVCVCVCVS